MYQWKLQYTLSRHFPSPIHTKMWTLTEKNILSTHLMTLMALSPFLCVHTSTQPCLFKPPFPHADFDELVTPLFPQAAPLGDDCWNKKLNRKPGIWSRVEIGHRVVLERRTPLRWDVRHFSVIIASLSSNYYSVPPPLVPESIAAWGHVEGPQRCLPLQTRWLMKSRLHLDTRVLGKLDVRLPMVTGSLACHSIFTMNFCFILGSRWWLKSWWIGPDFGRFWPWWSWW